MLEFTLYSHLRSGRVLWTSPPPSPDVICGGWDVTYFDWRSQLTWRCHCRPSYDRMVIRVHTLHCHFIPDDNLNIQCCTVAERRVGIVWVRWCPPRGITNVASFGEMLNSHKILVGKRKGNRPRGRLKYRWNDNYFIH